jgi:hypothetical protein
MVTMMRVKRVVVMGTFVVLMTLGSGLFHGAGMTAGTTTRTTAGMTADPLIASICPGTTVWCVPTRG